MRQIGEVLRTAGIDVWIDDLEINIGDSLIAKIADGIENADCVMAFISSHSVGSAWVQKELSIAMTTEIATRRLVVMPILLDQCEIPFFLIDKLYADFRGPDRLAEERKLIRSIHMLSTAASSSGELPDARPAAPLLPAAPGVAIGTQIVDPTRGYMGYRVARIERISGLAGISTGALAFFVVYIGRIRLPVVFVLMAVLCASTGALLMVASFFFERAFDRDKRLLVEIERIGSYVLPFDRKWRLQRAAAAHTLTYRIGHTLETCAVVGVYLMVIATAAFVVSLVKQGPP